MQSQQLDASLVPWSMWYQKNESAVVRVYGGSLLATYGK